MGASLFNGGRGLFLSGGGGASVLMGKGEGFEKNCRMGGKHCAPGTPPMPPTMGNLGLKHHINVIYSFCSWKIEISADFFSLVTDAPSEDRNPSLFNNEERLNFSNATFIASEIPLASWLNPRYSEKVNVGSMVSRSTKKHAHLFVQ